MSLEHAARPLGAGEGPITRIGIYGVFGVRNLGNEASLAAFVTGVRASLPDASILVVCTNPELVDPGLDVDVVSMSAPRLSEARLTRLAVAANRASSKVTGALWALRIAGRVDVMLIAGTGILEDTRSTPPWGVPLSVLTYSLACRLRGTRLAFVAIGVSPARTIVKRSMYRLSLWCASYRSYRDEYSRGSAAMTGLNASADPVFGDVVFAGSSAIPAPRIIDDGLVVLGVFDYRGEIDSDEAVDSISTRYREALVEFVSWLIDNGFRVQLTVGEASDTSVADRVLEDLRKVRTTLRAEECDVRSVESMDDLRDLMAPAVAVVATRYHNVIAALQVARPTIALGYAPKTEALMTRFGLADYVQPLNDIDQDLLRRQFATVVERRDECERTIRSALELQQTSVDEQFDDVADLIRPRHRVRAT